MTEPRSPEAGPEALGGTPAASVQAEPLGLDALAASAVAEVKAGRPASLWSDAWHDLIRNPLFLAASAMIAVLVAMAVVPWVFATVDATDASTCKLALARQGPGHGGWLGRDSLGCDLYSRTVYGARTSIVIGMLATSGTAATGGVLGLLAGFYGGWLDALLARLADVFFAIPVILGGLLILSVIGSGNIWTVALALTVVSWPLLFRIMRGAVITAKSQDYVTAARALGAGPVRLMGRHILPNAVAPVIVIATVNLGVFIAAEAALSYLGIGVQSPTISWGLMIADAQPRFLDAALPLIAPAVFLSVTVLSFIMLGDAVRDALDPKLR